MGKTKREEVVEAIRRIAEELGRPPSIAEFRKRSKISWHQVYRHFRGMRAAVRAAGLEPGPKGGPLNEKALVLDWARVVRELGRLPSRAEYTARGKHHAVTLHARVGWSQMAHRLVLLVKEFGLEGEWADVVETVCKKFPLLKSSTRHSAVRERSDHLVIGSSGDRVMGESPGEVKRSGELRIAIRGYVDRAAMKLGKVVEAAMAIEILMAAQKVADGRMTRSCDGPILYGEPLELAAMAHAPTNEDGVVFLFGVMAGELGFRVERIQRGFPDCEAKREIVPGKWERVRLEFEYESRNFREHRHDASECEAIVCWIHNWPEVPEGLEVVELRRLVRRS